MVSFFDFSVLSICKRICSQINCYHVFGVGLLFLLKRSLLFMHPFLGWRDYWIFFWQDIKSDAWVNIINVRLTEVEKSSTGTKTVFSGVTPIPFKFIQNAESGCMGSNIIPLVFVFLEYNLKHFRRKSLFSSSESDNCDLLLVDEDDTGVELFFFLDFFFLSFFLQAGSFQFPLALMIGLAGSETVNSTSCIISCRNIWIYCNLIYRKFIVWFVLYSILKIFEENSKNSNI